MILYAGEIRWEYIGPEDALALRHGETGLVFADALKAQLLKLNPGIVDEQRAGEIIRRLNLLRPTIEGNREALAALRGAG